MLVFFTSFSELLPGTSGIQPKLPPLNLVKESDQLYYATSGFVHLDRLHPLFIQEIHPGHQQNPVNPGIARISAMVGVLTKPQQEWLHQHPSTLGRLDQIAAMNGISDRQQANQIFDHFTYESDPILNAPLVAREVAYLKQLHPDWRLTRIVFKASWNVLSGQLHTVLDLVGLVPGLGEGADFVNGVFYILEGDKANATYSFLAMVPFAGWISTGAKYAGKMVKTAAKGTTELKFIVNSHGVVEFGSRKQLTRVIGGKTGYQAHHIIPWALNNHKVVQKAADSGDWHPNLALNGIHLDLSRHNGFITQEVHKIYNENVSGELDKVLDVFGDNISPGDALKQLKRVVNKIGLQFDQGKKLDEIVFL